MPNLLAGGIAVADHRRDELVVAEIADRRIGDQTAVAHHDNLLADLVNLLQMVRNEQERHALGLQAGDMIEELADLAGFEPRGRLVQDNEAAALSEGAGDLEKLALPHGQFAGALVGIHVEPPDLKRIAGQPPDLAPADRSEAPSRLIVDEQIFSDRQVRDDRRLLVDAGDPRPPRIPGRDVRGRLA